MRVLLDANVLISALLLESTPPGLILQAWRSGAFELITSVPLLREIDKVLSRPKLRERIRLSEAEAAEFIFYLSTNTTLVDPDDVAEGAVSDPNDIHVIGAAAAGAVNYLVTGDAALLRISGYRDLTIVSPARFLAIIRSSGS